jgi:hypothetical protein
MKRWMLVILLGMGCGNAARAQVDAAVVGPEAPVAGESGMIETPGQPSVAPCGPVEPICCWSFPRVWGSAEYLLWTMKDAPISAPLIVAGPGVANLAPVLGVPMQTVAIGGNDLSMSARSGGRFTLGYWGDDDRFGTSVTYLFLATASTGQVVGSTGQPGSAGLTVPFINATTGTESSSRVALPGGFAGVAALDVTNDLQGWEWNGLARIGDGERLRFHLLGGFRYLNLVERLTLNTNSPSVIGPPDVFATQDAFDCRNYFYGGQIGAQAEFRHKRLTIRTQGKVALGAMNEVVVTGGRLATTDFFGLSPLQTFPAGYLAGPTNNGKQSATRFAVVPEVNLNFGYQVTRRIALLVGWSFLYASDVVRPGDQIDRVVNPSQFPAITGLPTTTVVGAPRPAPQMNSTDFWAQGINFALQVNY